jgi:hypothetical protein
VNIRKDSLLISEAVKLNRYVYIGRGQGSIYGNPYTHLPLDSTKAEFSVPTVEEAVLKYEQYVRNNPELMRLLPTLVGKMLGCWCVKTPVSEVWAVDPKCHGLILIKLIRELGLEEP